jgi:hypothetical protein
LEPEVTEVVELLEDDDVGVVTGGAPPPVLVLPPVLVPTTEPPPVTTVPVLRLPLPVNCEDAIELGNVFVASTGIIRIPHELQPLSIIPLVSAIFICLLGAALAPGAGF